MLTLKYATSNREPPGLKGWTNQHGWTLTFFMVAPAELLASSLNWGNLKDPKRMLKQY